MWIIYMRVWLNSVPTGLGRYWETGCCRLKKGRSKRAHLLCEAVYQATQNFIAKGEEISNENAEVRNEMVAAVDDVRRTGQFL